MPTAEKPIKASEKIKDLTKEETKYLVELYKLINLTQEDIKNALTSHYAEFGRVGFNSEVDEETINYFYKHFTNNPKEYLESEHRFIQEILESDLTSVAEQSFARAKEFLPEQSYKNPQAVFLMNGKRTDAKVIGSRQFGINLQNLFSSVYSRKSNTYNTEKALLLILDACAHEGNHICLSQVVCSDKKRVTWVIETAFMEGLATLAQTGFYFPWSEDYLEESDLYIRIVTKISAKTTNEQKTTILKELCDMPSLQKHNIVAIESVKPLLEMEKISEKEFNKALSELLVKKNGPLYYAGYSVWKKILDKVELEGLRELVKQGPGAYEAFFCT